MVRSGKQPSSNVRKPKRIVLLTRNHRNHLWLLLRGIYDYANNAGDWQCIPVEPDPNVIPVLERQRPDGILATFPDRELALAVQKLGKPTVELLDPFHKPVFPRVSFDNLKIGRMAAEYFLSQGFRSFSFLGPMGTIWASERYRGLAERLGEVGFSALKFDSGGHTSSGWGKTSWCASVPDLQNWLKRLPKPTALLAANDIYAHGVLDSAWMLGMKVPDDLSVLGVDNDAVMCELLRPALSSVANNPTLVGFKAASILGKMLQGTKIPVQEFRIDPAEIVSRQSTNFIATSDPEVAEALQYIRTMVARGIDVDRVVARVALSRRTLERRFQTQLNRGIQEEIARSRLELARQYLRTTDLSVDQIWRRSGFSSEAQLFRTFRDNEGLSPRKYRLQFRLGS